MRRIFVLPLLLSLVVIADSAIAACAITPFHFIWGTEAHAHIRSDGGICRISLIAAFGTSEVHSFSIVAAPSNGSASVSSRVVAYRPRTGFKGEDSFVFAVVGRGQGAQTRATVRVFAKVQ